MLRLKRGKLIVVLGPVGVGKSMIIRAFLSLSRERGIKAKSVYIKAFHGPSYLLWKIVSRVMAHKANNKLAPWYIIGKINKILSRRLLFISIFFDSITIPFIVMSKVVIPRLRGVNIFVEEYLLGTLLDYAYSFYEVGKKDYLHLLPFKILKSLCLRYRPGLVILLDADLFRLRKHWKVRGYGDPQIKYVLSQKRILPKLAQALYGSERVVELEMASAPVADLIERAWRLCDVEDEIARTHNKG
jgi:ABC-type dipeptide/oligopeptide/nickel transport system ATPase component